VSVNAGEVAACPPDALPVQASAATGVKRGWRLPRTPFDQLSTVVTILGALLLGYALLSWSRLHWHLPLAAAGVVVVLAIAGELANVPFAISGRRREVGWGEVSLLVGLACLPLPVLVLIKAGTMLFECWRTRRGWKRITFNTMATLLYNYPAVLATAGLASLCGTRLGTPGSWPLLLIGGLIAAGLNLAILAIALASLGVAPVRQTFSSFFWMANLAGNALVSLLMLAAWRYSRESLLALPLLLIMLWQTHRRHMTKDTERDALTRLAAASAAMPALSFVEMTDEVRRRARDLFGATGIQLRLTEEPPLPGTGRAESRSSSSVVEATSAYSRSRLLSPDI
jgi:hypothetical protein